MGAGKGTGARTGNVLDPSNVGYPPLIVRYTRATPMHHISKL
jgi:hypothetical protein